MLRLRFEKAYIDEAIDLLRPITRPASGYEFLILTHQAHAFAIRPNGRDLARAFEFEESAVKDYDFPKTIPGLKAPGMKNGIADWSEITIAFLRHRL